MSLDVFRVRLNCIDHYQASPTPLDPPLHGKHGRPSQKTPPPVPVIRVFGATETGQKVCAHIHGALPYLYLEYQGGLVHAEDPNNTFVAHISLVKGIPFFGYHVGYRTYTKIYLHNPLHMTRLSDLLAQGAIMGKALQPHESHLQYLLQFMCDFNLYGCAYIEITNPKFRAPVPEYTELCKNAGGGTLTHVWHDRSIPSSQISDPDMYPRQSHCQIEVDFRVQDILNRHEIRPRSLHHDFVERLTSTTLDEKLVQSMAGLWSDETRRRKRRMGITDPSSSPFPPEVLVSMSADARNVKKGGWIHEEEYRRLVESLTKEEKEKDQRARCGLEGFIKSMPGEETVRTTLESVEDLFHENLASEHQEAMLQEDAATVLPTNAASPSRVGGLDAKKEPLVDESTVLQYDDDDLPYESDEEVAKEIALTQMNNEKKILLHADGIITNSQADETSKPDGEGGAHQFADSDDPALGSMVSPEYIAQAALVSESAAKRPHGAISNSHQDNERSPKRHKTNQANGVHKLQPKEQRTKRVGFVVKDCVDGKPAVKESTVLADFTGPEPETERSYFGSQSSQKHKPPTVRGGNRTLPFPVVKNANDPDTAIRLSQRSDIPGSQPKPETSLKSVSFEESPKKPWSNTTSSVATSPASEPLVHPKVLRLTRELGKAFVASEDRHVSIYSWLPPSAEEVESTMVEVGIPPVIYQDAHYSSEKDVPDRPREYAGQEFKLESTTVPFLALFSSAGTDPASRGMKAPIVLDKAKEDLLHQRRSRQCTLKNWQIEKPPPTWQEVSSWLREPAAEIVDGDATFDPEGPEMNMPSASQIKRKNRPASELSQIEGPTQKNRHGFKYAQRHESTSVQHETQYMSTMSLEVHVNSREELAPDPAKDEVACVFWCIQSEDTDFLTGPGAHDGIRTGIVALSGSNTGDIAKKIRQQSVFEVEEEDNELDLINRVVDIVRAYDPDILTGYEVHNGSWGYLIERARLVYEYDLCDEFSRMKSQSHGRFGKDADRWGFTHTSTIRVTGRHMINIWRAMRSELNLLQYTMENVVFHLLQRRIPHYSFSDLTRWWKSGKPRDLAKALEYWTTRARLDLEILEANELIARTSEQARLLGVDFFSVFSRGSQFKVESLMFRIAKPESFVLVSPSRKQVGQQNALECLPLVMEPQSAFYTSPLLVLDFQSLYPSVMIAYNYCYSTCLGRVVGWRGHNKLGFTDFKRELGLLGLVKDNLNIAPNGMMFVKPQMRKSLLAKMLGEILETRVMVKSGMKVDRDDKTLQQLLNNRQLALKLIANVTYGYTSASFSGRMPCSEIADSIVQTGRETLEKAIALIHSVERWGAEVVYGDTDSLFVYLKGRTRDQAFQIGDEIAKAVTDTNPRPVKLKFEKVYHPCILLAKKRYVGFKYESPSQSVPEFDAKGIETVRRDGTPAEQKIEEKALKILFRTADLSAVKSYFQTQCAKILAGKFSIQDF
ncbi:DNA polymerase zeta, partial [Elasticomyces elasticus]